MAAKVKKTVEAPKTEVKAVKVKKTVEAPKVEVKAVKNVSMKTFETILRPVITEKTMAQIQNLNKVTVEVNPKSNRTEIKLAFEALYKVKVENVHIVNVLAHETRRGGKYKGSVPGFKKAIVTLSEGQALDLFKE
jgi:large subunit ribosomal protein L23